MCGIYASISTRGLQPLSQDLRQLLSNRGPDHIGGAEAQIDTKDGASFFISLSSTVLSLRGGLLTPQPFVNHSNGSALCWNGEAWKTGPDPVVDNDGQAIFASLIRASATQSIASESVIAVLRVLQNLSGPFAFVFLDKIHSQIYFGRDRLGRRSLLYNNSKECIEFSSVAGSTDGSWKEVEADGIYRLSCHVGTPTCGSEMSTHQLSSTSIIPFSKHAWQSTDSGILSPSLGLFNRALPTHHHIFNSQTPSIAALRHELGESLKLRILNVPLPPILEQGETVRVAILFSGGLDCTVLARMAHDILPSEQYIDLINVAFENPRVVQATKNAAKSLKHSLAEVQVGTNDEDPSAAFSPFESCPDRETGRKAFQELQRVCSGRIWRFVAVNIPYAETIAHRAKVINLIYPHNTEMDLSIAYALYFAARGTGIPSSNLIIEPPIYTTPARVLLSGLGADELFGGYTRHATAFSRRGIQALLDELELDVNRLGKRNLGRDDRVISHWGREARFPYLDESLVKWAVECPVWEKCGFQLIPSDKLEIPEVEPGKKVLRLLAHELGMHSVAQEKKRAIQFGARTARMEIGRTKGTALIS